VVVPVGIPIRLLRITTATRGFQPCDGDYEGIDRILRG